MNGTRLTAVPVLLVVVVALVTGLLAGLMRIGWTMPPVVAERIGLHGPLLAAGVPGHAHRARARRGDERCHRSPLGPRVAGTAGRSRGHGRAARLGCDAGRAVAAPRRRRGPPRGQPGDAPDAPHARRAGDGDRGRVPGARRRRLADGPADPAPRPLVDGVPGPDDRGRAHRARPDPGPGPDRGRGCSRSWSVGT